MKSQVIFSSLLTLALAIPESEWATNPPTLDITKPIYLASVFFPPQMHYALWTPPKDDSELKDQSPFDWCRNALDVTDSMSFGSRTPPFELEGLEGLKVHDFFTDQAYISRHNTRFADCFITPESRKIGFCEGRKEEEEFFLGTAHLVWSCYVGKSDRRQVLGPREESVFEGMTVGGDYLEAEKTGASIGGSANSAFTAVVTGS